MTPHTGALPDKLVDRFGRDERGYGHGGVCFGSRRPIGHACGPGGCQQISGSRTQAGISGRG